MIISRKNNQLIDFNIKINDKTITQTTCVKYLGVFIGERTWSNHITYLEKNSHSVGISHQIRQYLSQWYPTFFGVGTEFQISEYVWSRMKTLKELQRNL